MITVIINAHHEGRLLAHAISSAISNKSKLQESHNVEVEIQVLLDRADRLTRDTSLQSAQVTTVEVDFGDLSLSRNFGALNSRAAFIAYLDGDDLWGTNWLKSAYELYCEAGLNRELILHPEVSLYFGHNTRGSLKAMKHPSTGDSGFEPNGLLFRNFWTALSFGKRETYLKHSFEPIDRRLLLGFEDWTFNWMTVLAGIEHVAVPGTVHFLRTKFRNSLLKDSSRLGLLPRL